LSELANKKLIEDQIAFQIAGATPVRPRARVQSLVRLGPKLFCPVCDSECQTEKCKVICRSEICRGRVVMNCSEF